MTTTITAPNEYGTLPLRELPEGIQSYAPRHDDESPVLELRFKDYRVPTDVCLWTVLTDGKLYAGLSQIGMGDVGPNTEGKTHQDFRTYAGKKPNIYRIEEAQNGQALARFNALKSVLPGTTLDDVLTILRTGNEPEKPL